MLCSSKYLQNTFKLVLDLHLVLFGHFGQQNRWPRIDLEILPDNPKPNELTAFKLFFGRKILQSLTKVHFIIWDKSHLSSSEH